MMYDELRPQSVFHFCERVQFQNFAMIRRRLSYLDKT